MSHGGQVVVGIEARSVQQLALGGASGDIRATIIMVHSADQRSLIARRSPPHHDDWSGKKDLENE